MLEIGAVWGKLSLISKDQIKMFPRTQNLSSYVDIFMEIYVKI
jgi:hypothetical protein